MTGSLMSQTIGSQPIRSQVNFPEAIIEPIVQGSPSSPADLPADHSITIFGCGHAFAGRAEPERPVR